MVAIVTPKEMKEIETAAFKSGISETELMQKAGKGIAEALIPFLNKEKKLSVICGKGNNAGDGFVAAFHLLQKGILVEVLQLEKEEACSPLCQKMRKRFIEAGGKVFSPLETYAFQGAILDALFGTGFKGVVAEPYLSIIEKANASGLAIYSIDIPSGVSGETGSVESSAIRANKTLFLENPKRGFFLKDGWNHVGELIKIPLDLQAFSKGCLENSFSLIEPLEMALCLPPIVRNRHKYQTGSVVGVAGSSEMPGAAMIASLAAFRAGAGIVRLFHPEGMESLLAAAPYELIRTPFSYLDGKNVCEAMQKSRALFIGPGLGFSEEISQFFFKILQECRVPTVIDADALKVVCDSCLKLPSETVLTPHLGEMAHLLGEEKRLTLDESLLARCQQFAKEREVTLVLKGAPTFIFSSDGKEIFCSTPGDPGMATAGSGDCLTGIIAALLSQGLKTHDAAKLGVYLHGVSGMLVRQKRGTSYGMMATDLISGLATAYSWLSRCL